SSSGQGILPTIVVHQGTILLEDRFANPDLPPVELGDLNLTVVNDPTSIITIEGSGSSNVLGALKFHGVWQPGTQQVQLTLEASGMSLTPALLQRMASMVGGTAASAVNSLRLEGKVDCKAEITFRGARGNEPRAENAAQDETRDDPPPPRFQYEVRCHLKQGKLTHPDIPLPL